MKPLRQSTLNHGRYIKFFLHASESADWSLWIKLSQLKLKRVCRCFGAAQSRIPAKPPTLMWPPGLIGTWTVESPCRWTRLRAQAAITTAMTAGARRKLCTTVTRTSRLTWRSEHASGSSSGSGHADMLRSCEDYEWGFSLCVTDIRGEIWSYSFSGS